MKYFFRFLIIITRKGNFIPKVFLGSAGHVIYVVLTLLPSISRTRLWMSLSVILLICPFLTFLSQICSGLLPMLYRMDRKPLWKVFLNIFGFAQDPTALTIFPDLCSKTRFLLFYFLVKPAI